MSVVLRHLFTKLSLRTASKCLCSNVHSAYKSNFLGTVANNFYSSTPVPFEVVDPKAKQKIQSEVINKVNEQVAEGKHGRLFAVVHVAGKQFKVTEGDVIVVEGYWPPSPGDKLKFDKILLAGAEDFTLIGRPLIQDGLVNVFATIIEKTLSHTKTNFKKKRRKQYTQIDCKYYNDQTHWGVDFLQNEKMRVQHTMVRINKIEVKGKVNSPPEVTGAEYKIF